MKSCSYDGSPCLPDASYYDESTTCTGIVSSICTSCTPCYTYFCCTSFSCLCSSYSFRSCSFNSCNSFFVSSILHFYLCLRAFLLPRCCLSTSISKVAFGTSGSARNLKLFSSSMWSIIFLLPLSHTGMFTSVVVVAYGALWEATSRYFAIHSKTRPTGSLSMEEFLTISPWVLLRPMTCLVDPVELYSRAMIFHKPMWVIRIVTSEVEWILLHLLCFNICMLETPYLV